MFDAMLELSEPSWGGWTFLLLVLWIIFGAMSDWRAK